MDALSLDPRTTALVIIDLQRGIVGRQTAPHSAAQVVERARRLAERCRETSATVVLVHVAYAADGRDRLTQRVDAAPWAGAVAPDFSDIVPELGPKPGDVVVTKRQWGAFYGTELDLVLRRRGIRTIILGGISTNFGVESTARDAWERGYQLVFAEDAMAGMASEAHQFAVTAIFPRLGLVRSTEDVLKALKPLVP
ncbi:MAG TPA: hydrolase [Gemmatimonadales bacterium]|nr:hydrolase [Gemmatimonadales bacterium]